MKTSYKICGLLMALIVMVMIVGGVIQDRRAKKARVIESVNKTMTAAGCKEVDSDYDPANDSSFSGEGPLNVLSLDSGDSAVLAARRYVIDSKGSFSDIINELFQGAKYYRIGEIDVDGKVATVNIEFFYANQEHTVDMEFTYGEDGWVLSNGESAVLSLFSK